MKFAISMYKPGERVYPEQCNFFSYNDLKLRCPVCGEPVRLKKGGTRKPHFAHFPGTDPKQVEECELRASIYSNNTQINSFIQDRGQRLEIFQQHFISMIYVGQEKIVDDVKFKNWIDAIKRDNNQAINNIANDCIEYFLTHQKQMDVYCVFLKNEQPLLQQQIALEAIDYLCVKSSNRLLQYIIYYCIYRLNKQNFTKNDIDSICHRAIKIIMLNPWIRALDNSKSINSLTINISQLFEPEIVNTKSPSPLQIFLAAIQDGTKGKSNKNINSSNINASGLFNVERDILKSPLYLNHIFPAIQYASRGGVKKVIISSKVVTEINTDENTAIQFSFMVNEFIKVDSRIQNASGNYVKAEIEIWHPAIVYSFGYDLILKIETYSNLLFPKGGHLEEYTYITRRDELASIFQALLSDGKVELLKTYKDSKGIVRINYAYDCSVLLLYELLEYCHIGLLSKYEPIEFTTVLQCMINAGNKAVKLGIPLINGMLLHSLFTAAKEELKASRNEMLLNDKQREIDNEFQINRKVKLNRIKRQTRADKYSSYNMRKRLFTSF